MFTFIGDFECKTDAKGRIVFPSAFKKVLGEGDLRMIVRKDLFEPCLVLYPFSVWEEELARIRTGLNPYNREHNRFLRHFFRGSAEISLDGNGRFLIPKRLLEQAGIEREVVLLGVDRYIEIWDKGSYMDGSLSHKELGNLAEKILGDTHPEEDN
ncbi:MAG: cell division protein MraZ [Anaerophaga sp.]|uniref:division/cell wall cluster transcriptional repressor MraZ n=1 Tax=Anaerophaga thermohalophila TaxID=177400 RepID=UPI000237CFDB|nr:division/cell wall cluster transcriptional repressor MraZ [Anaerophaga thermohalophila]MBZ4675644.1 cell division protein MraZ [Anaerophaga sp.]MDK2842160.1 transcriptional regulator MraZ [Anaerophaga sp.]MDN5292133.1 transcriptional regulator MraZ [Anaerophaga sp.]